MSLAGVYAHQIKLLDNLFLGYDGPTFAIRFPMWSWRSSTARQPIFSLVFRSFDNFCRLLQPSEIALGEAFISGEIDVEGDIFSAFGVAQWLLDRHTGLASHIMAELIHDSSAFLRWLTRGRKHSRERDAASVSYHYDLPVEFYEPWLGATLLYSAGYFRYPEEGLDTAQTDKLDLICKKLNLRPGDRFMDIGCRSY